jgi:hypothetical protein
LAPERTINGLVCDVAIGQLGFAQQPRGDFDARQIVSLIVMVRNHQSFANNHCFSLRRHLSPPQRAGMTARQRPLVCRFSRFAARFSSKVFAGFFFVCFF